MELSKNKIKIQNLLIESSDNIKNNLKPYSKKQKYRFVPSTRKKTEHHDHQKTKNKNSKMMQSPMNKSYLNCIKRKRFLSNNQRKTKQERKFIYSPKMRSYHSIKDNHFSPKEKINNQYIKLLEKSMTNKNNKNNRYKEQEKIEKNIKYGLSEEEFKQYGDRFPQGYKKLQLIGRGGFSLVWAAQSLKTKKQYAIKQFNNKGQDSVYIKEIWMGQFFFEDGHIRSEFSKHPGIRCLLKYYGHIFQQEDIWLIFQLGNDSLSNTLFKVYKKNDMECKRYKVKHRQLYKLLINDPQILQFLMRELVYCLALLSQHNIVHVDIKPQNILINVKNNKIQSAKLIDFGSFCLSSNIKHINMATPQYTSPQILNYLQYQNKQLYDQNFLQVIKKQENSSIDIWSLAIVFLQIIYGVPVWMKFVQVSCDNKHFVQTSGLFSTSNRNFLQIMKKQKYVIENIESILKEKSLSKIQVTNRLISVLKGMLNLNPQQRIFPKEIINMLGQKYEFDDNFLFYN